MKTKRAPGRPPRLTPAQAAGIVAMRAAGASLHETARTFGISHVHVMRIVRGTPRWIARLNTA